MSKADKKLFIPVFFDVLMIIILFINLSWIVVDWIFAIEAVEQFIKTNFEAVHSFYSPIHKNFFYYDLIFVAIFITEIIIRWIIAIVKHTHYKWFFYPIIHWYDVLGTIPAGGFILLRFLRIFSIVYRLNELKIIDIQKTYIFKKVYKYYNIVVEEISDRVVVKVLEGVQVEMKSGAPVADRIIDEVVAPNQNLITNLITEKIGIISEQIFEKHKFELNKYISRKVEFVFKDNKDVRKIEKIPVVGSTISVSLQKSINEIVYKVIENVVQDVSSPRTDKNIKQIADNIFNSLIVDAGKDTNSIIQNIVIDAIEIIKDQVKVQNWKVEEIKQLEQKLSETSNPKQRLKISKLIEKKRSEL